MVDEVVGETKLGPRVEVNMHMSRRRFLRMALASGALSYVPAFATQTLAGSRIYHVLGVPLRAGSFYPGTEDDAKAYREAGLIDRMRSAGCEVLDDGDIQIPSYLPHHAIPPVRNWPAPRIAWDSISQRLAEILRRPSHVPVLIGCDCSVVIASTQALLQSGVPNVHVLYVDGDFDAAEPQSARVQSAASVAVWLLTHESPFWTGPVLQSSQITPVGASVATRSPVPGAITLADIRRLGVQTAAANALKAVADSAAVILHIDVDVLRDDSFPIAYFPHADGLSLDELRELMTVLVRDPRVRIVELSEYAGLRDADRTLAAQLSDAFAMALGSGPIG
jgi:arginase family enzyme